MTLSTAVLVFLACAVVIALAGTRLAGTVDELADRTGLGEAVAGAVLLGASTSLPGSVLAVTASLDGNPELAVSNGLGGIAAQTLFLVFADLTYRRVNLEHAAASLGNIAQATLLMGLLALILLGPLLPAWEVGGVHPVTPVLLVSYVVGIRIVRKVQQEPMWTPARTPETREDVAEESPSGRSLGALWLRFALLGTVLGFAGWLLGPSADVIAAATGLGHAVVGVFFTAIATSLPELVTTLAAVRHGALTMAVAGIIGGNAFDTIFVAISDISYRGGSVYHVISDQVLLWAVVAILMTAALIMGLIRREERGPARIGWESATVLGLYVAAGLVLVLA